MDPLIGKALEVLGVPLLRRERCAETLERFADFLADEAIPAGGLGPEEGPRLIERHLIDSLLFARPWWPERAGSRVADLGSGIGLPAIPLAVMDPELEVVGVERSQRRVDLARRAARILGIDNLIVRHADMDQLAGAYGVVVARAVRSPGALRSLLGRVVAPGGIAVVGGSRRSEPHVPGYVSHRVDPGILDHPVWVLIMTA